MVRKLKNNDVNTVSGGKIINVGPFYLKRDSANKIHPNMLPLVENKYGDFEGQNRLVIEEKTGKYIDENGNRCDGNALIQGADGKIYREWQFIKPYSMEVAEELDRRFNPQNYQ